MNFSKFVQMRLQGANPDTPIANDIFGGSEPAGTTQTIQKADPWAGVQPYMLDIFQRGQALSNRPNALASQSPETLQAQNLQAQRAMQGSPLIPAAQQQAMDTISGKYTDLASNPAAQSAMNAARSQINGQFSGDNYGNSAHQEWLTKGLMSAAAPFYESERTRQMQATAAAPAMAAADYSDIGQLGAVGAAKDARAQQVQDFPWQNLFNFQRAVAGSGATGGTTTSEQPYFNNPMGNALGLGLGAAGLYSMLGSGAAAASPSLLAGAGLLSFSDVRLKTDIKKLGEREDGLGVYSYRYKGDSTPQVGVMAQEVLKVKPEAVHDIDGLLAVDYGAI